MAVPLAQYGLAPQQVEAWIAHDLSIFHQVEARLRPAVQIAPQTIESYYRDTFLPQFAKPVLKMFPSRRSRPRSAKF